MSAIQSATDNNECRMMVLSRVASNLLGEVACSNPFQLLMSSGAETSEASGTETPEPSDSEEYATAEEMVDPDAYDADAEIDAADGVEGKAAALQSPIPPHCS